MADADPGSQPEVPGQRPCRPWPSKPVAAPLTRSIRKRPGTPTWACRDVVLGKVLQVREADSDVTLSGLRGVGAVDDVLADGQCEVAADGARGGCLDRVGATSQLTPSSDSGLALDDAGDQWCGGDEVHELAEERLVLVLLVVLLCGCAVCG